MAELCALWQQFGECTDIRITQHHHHQYVLLKSTVELNWRIYTKGGGHWIANILQQTCSTRRSQVHWILGKYNTSSKKAKYYEDNPDTENNVTLDRHFFKVHMDAAGIQYVYCPARQVKRCIRIEMLYVTSGDIFYLRLILLNRKAHSDQDVLTHK